MPSREVRAHQLGLGRAVKGEVQARCTETQTHALREAMENRKTRGAEAAPSPSPEGHPVPATPIPLPALGAPTLGPGGVPRNPDTRPAPVKRTGRCHPPPASPGVCRASAPQAAVSVLPAPWDGFAWDLLPEGGFLCPRSRKGTTRCSTSLKILIALLVSSSGSCSGGTRDRRCARGWQLWLLEQWHQGQEVCPGVAALAPAAVAPGTGGAPRGVSSASACSSQNSLKLGKTTRP